MPPLRTALAYEAIFGKPVAELFGGTYDPIKSEVARRARLLLGVLQAAGKPHVTRKRSVEAIFTGR